MREIKFRAWDKDEKRMIYLANNMGSQTHLQLNNHSWGVFEPDSEDYYGIASANSNLGDILMQYTGLKDKNGNEIYEGDIVKCDYFTGIVDYRENAGLYLIGNEKEGKAITFFDIQMSKAIVEVIGNIYENPELLEGRE